MVGNIKTLVRYILDAHRAYNGTGMMMALYFIVLFYIGFYCKDKKIRKAVVLPSVFLMCIPYIGVPLYDTFRQYLEAYDGRLFWIIITPLVIAAGFTMILFEIEDDRKRFMALAVLAVILVFCGEFKISNAMYHKAENQYRLPEATVEITEHVTEEMEAPKLIVPYTIAHPFRQISTDVMLLYGEDASYGRIIRADEEYIRICEEMERVTPDLNYIVPIAKEQHVNYILFDTVYTELCEDGNINMYGYPVDENYVGDRTPTIELKDLNGVDIIETESDRYWDLTEYDLEYDGRFGQYVLYRFR